MAIVLFTVQATITPEQEAAFNRWYNDEHCPQLLRFNGAVKARRYRRLLGDDKFQYMAQYEFADEAAFERFQQSEDFAALKREYETHFGETSERRRDAWVQIWP
jgi:antibiotic biosynthesis monooxygenase (ABM) superfamily enzyme